MNTTKRIQILDTEIERLKQVRALLSGQAIKFSHGLPAQRQARTAARGFDRHRGKNGCI
jgi:hypothetical protein